MDAIKRYGTRVEEEQQGLAAYVKELIRKPFDIAFSTTARRAYLTSFLITFAALTLLGFAITAYILFYWSYIPRIGFERTIHLQFDNVFDTSDSRYDGAGNPYGTISLSPDIVSMQRYDVLVELTLPRTPDNRNVGNFMLEAAMYARGTMIDPVKETIIPGTAKADNRLAFSRRPAILAYRSLVVEALHRLTQLHWYLVGWRNEDEKLTVEMWESVEFSRGWRNVPATMTLVVQSVRRMQIYSAKAVFRARFRGLRWLMYNHRILSAIIFINGFWITEMLFAGLAWAALSTYGEPHSQIPKPEAADRDAQRIKQEAEQDEKANLSDTERTFPTSSKQQPLRHESSKIKQEDDEDTVILPEAPSRATEADDEDEDEDADVFVDSGLGTSMESSANRRDSMRRRKARVRAEDDHK